MRFDYLHPARPPTLTRVLDMRVPQRFHVALVAAGAAAAIVAGACSIEAYRLREAREMQAAYQQRYDAVNAQLRRSKLYGDRVRAIAALDRRVRRISASGYADARMLAEIANRLPQHAWLTAIAHDASGLALQGQAKDLAVLSGVMRGLMAVNDVRTPSLLRASEEQLGNRADGLTYEIHVDGGRQ